MPLTARFLGLFACFLVFFQPIFAQDELGSLLQNLTPTQKMAFAESILSENLDSIDPHLEQLFSHLSVEEKKRVLGHFFEEKEIDGEPIRTLAVLERDTIDFGSVRRGEFFSHTVELRNLGDGPYFLSKIISPCGCLTALGPEKLIEPGKKATIRVNLDPENLARGPFQQTLVLRDNSMPNQRLLLAIRAKIE